jgi:uncharacterized protein with beta-barrel porin domain
VSYDANNVFLEVDLAKLSSLLPSNANINQTDAVKGIDNAIAAGDTVPMAIQNLGNLSSEALGQGAAQLSGELGASLTQISAEQLQPMLDAITDHTLDVGQYRPRSKGSKPGSRIRYWGTALTSVSMVNGDLDNEGTHRLKSTLAGLVGGVDLNVSPRLLVGAAMSIEASDFRLASSFGKGSAQAAEAAVYGAYDFNSVFYNSYVIAAGLNYFSTRRSLTINGTDMLKAKVVSESVGGRYEFGARFDGLSPYVGFQGQLTRTPDYHEVALAGSDAFALKYAANTSFSSAFEVGFRHAVDVRSGDWTFLFSDRLAWSHGFDGNYAVEAAYNSLPDSKFTTFGASPSRDAALVSLGVAANSDSGLSLNAHLESATTGRSQTFTEMTGLSFRW